MKTLRALIILLAICVLVQSSSAQRDTSNWPLADSIQLLFRVYGSFHDIREIPGSPGNYDKSEKGSEAGGQHFGNRTGGIAHYTIKNTIHFGRHWGSYPYGGSWSLDLAIDSTAKYIKSLQYSEEWDDGPFHHNEFRIALNDLDYSQSVISLHDSASSKHFTSAYYSYYFGRMSADHESSFLEKADSFQVEAAFIPHILSAQEQRLSHQLQFEFSSEPRLTFQPSSQIRELVIYDMLGRSVRRSELPAESSSDKIVGLVPGVYIAALGSETARVLIPR